MELAVIDVSASSAPTNMAAFGKKIAPRVCEAGGDAAIADANGEGKWIKATVIKRLPARQKRGSKPAGQSSTPAGCSYDTQCKGDRICVDGKCVSPPPAAPTQPAVPEAAFQPES